MMRSLSWLAIVTSAAFASALPVVAETAPQRADQLGSSFQIIGRRVTDDGALLARSGGTLVELQARPVSAVRLTQTIPAETGALFGVTPDSPFDADRVLTGWPERPGLYCDLLRTRGLGLSTACLRDTDGDGRFDEGRRYDFNSGLGDLLGVTASGKIIGVRTTAKNPASVRLPQPVPFTAVGVPSGIAGRLALKWRKIKLAGQPMAQLWISTPGNYTGTEGVSAQVAQFPLTKVPLEGEFYGVRLRVLGFDEKGAMRYQVLEVRDGATVPLMFRGYTFRYIMI